MGTSIGVASFSILHATDNYLDDNVDVVIRLDDGSSYGATFFTPTNILTVLSRYQSSGECLAGTFLWARDMIIVKDLKPSTLESSIRELVRSGEYKHAFGVLEAAT